VSLRKKGRMVALETMRTVEKGGELACRHPGAEEKRQEDKGKGWASCKGKT